MTVFLHSEQHHHHTPDSSEDKSLCPHCNSRESLHGDREGGLSEGGAGECKRGPAASSGGGGAAGGRQPSAERAPQLVCVCVCVCVCACMRECVNACVRACVCARREGGRVEGREGGREGGREIWRNDSVNSTRSHTSRRPPSCWPRVQWHWASSSQEELSLSCGGDT